MKQLCRTHEVIHVKLELTAFMLQHDALPLKSCPHTYHRGPKANKLLIWHLENTTMWGPLRLAPIILATPERCFIMQGDL